MYCCRACCWHGLVTTLLGSLAGAGGWKAKILQSVSHGVATTDKGCSTPWIISPRQQVLHEDSSCLRELLWSLAGVWVSADAQRGDTARQHCSKNLFSSAFQGRDASCLITAGNNSFSFSLSISSEILQLKSSQSSTYFTSLTHPPITWGGDCINRDIKLHSGPWRSSATGGFDSCK